MKRLILLLAALAFLAGTARAQWVNQNAGFTGKTLGFYEISIVNKDVVWAICYDGVGGLFGPAHVLDFTRTADGGLTWMPGLMGTDSSLAFSSICALSDTEAWVAMHKFDLSTKGGGLFHTTDGGVTWNQSGVGTIFDTNSFPNFVYFKNQLEGLAVGDANGGYFEIYTTADGGNSWTRTPQGNIPAFVTGGGSGWFDGFAVLGDTVWFGTAGGEMYKSIDFGQNWSVHTVSTQGYTVYEIAFNDDGRHGLTHVRSNSSTMLFATSDGGSTWAQLPTHPKWKQSKLTAVPGTNWFVSTGVFTNASSRGSAYTNDLGATWIEIENATPKAACRFLDSATGWSGGYFNDIPQQSVLSGGIYKWDITGLNIANQEPKPDATIVISPNPASETITVEYKAGGTLRISNIAGKVVLTEKLSGSQGRITISVASLPAGIYGYQHEDGKGAVRNGKLAIRK